LSSGNLASLLYEGNQVRSLVVVVCNPAADARQNQANRFANEAVKRSNRVPDQLYDPGRRVSGMMLKNVQFEWNPLILLADPAGQYLQ